MKFLVALFLILIICGNIVAQESLDPGLVRAMAADFFDAWHPGLEEKAGMWPTEMYRTIFATMFVYHYLWVTQNIVTTRNYMYNRHIYELNINHPHGLNCSCIMLGETSMFEDLRKK